MFHLEKFDAIVHDLIESAAIGCDVLFRRTAINAQFCRRIRRAYAEAC